MKNNKKQTQKIPLLFLLLLLICMPIMAQNGVIVKGVVVDDNGDPITGATITVKGNRTIGTITNIDGDFAITVPNAKSVLVISFIGMIPQEVVANSSSRLKITLADNAEQLEEVVVVGYGQQKKASVVGAITQTSGKVLERAGGVSDIGAALTGNLPGVITTASTGMPGEEQPKIVIRGVSSWNNSDPLILVDGIERPMNSVDISSVQSISVLKDASATAVYGVKGANGVILITTKRGNEGRAKIDIGVNMTTKMASKLPGKYDAYDALMLRNAAIENELGIAPESWNSILPVSEIEKYRSQSTLEEYERYPNVDWTDALFKNHAMSYNANINVSGGTKYVRYFAAVDYLHEGDLFREWDNKRGYNAGYGYNRVNARSNLDFNLTKTTVLRTNISGSHGVRKTPWNISDDSYGATQLWQAAYSTPSDAFLPVYSDGSWGYYPNDTQGAPNSVVNLALSGVEKKTTTRINTDFTLEQDLGFILKGLNVRGTISWDNTFLETGRGINDLYNDTQYKWINPATGEVFYKQAFDGYNKFDFQENIAWTTQGGSVANWMTVRNLFYQAQVNWSGVFGKNTIAAMGVFNRNERATGSEFSHYREDWAFRVTYDYANRYFFEYNGAYNGSEKFSKENRFHFFNSGAIGWMISEEKFFKPVRKVIDMLKIRASYGEIGDDNVVGRWLYETQWAYGTTALMGLNPMQNERSPYTWYYENIIGNSNVHWEKAVKKNLGIDFSLFTGILAGTVEIFNDKRTDILVAGGNRAIPSYFGATAPVANLGRVRTKGYEVELRFNYMFANKFRLWANFNMTHAENKILNYDDADLLASYKKNAGYAIGQAHSYIDNGYINSWDEIYGSTQHNTMDNQKLPGGFNIIDFNGDGVIDTNDNVPYGYTGTPQNTYNGTLGFEWKGFSGFVQFYGVTNVNRYVSFSTFSGKLNVAFDEGSYWNAESGYGDVPMPRWNSTPSGFANGTRYMYDGSYIRLKNVELGYTFTNSWVKRIGLGDLRLFVNGNNLWMWSRMPDDRESNTAGTGLASQGAYPTMKRVNVGIKFSL